MTEEELRLMERLVKQLRSRADDIERMVKGSDRHPRGVYVTRAPFGYDVMVDGCNLGIDVSYTTARRLHDLIDASKEGFPVSMELEIGSNSDNSQYPGYETEEEE